MQGRFILRMHLRKTKLSCELIDLESMQIASFPRPIRFPLKKQKRIFNLYYTILREMRKDSDTSPAWFKDQVKTLGVQLWKGLLDRVFLKFDLDSREGSPLTLALDEETIRFPWELGLYRKRPQTLLCETLNIGRLRVVKYPYWVNPRKRPLKKIHALVVGLNYDSYRNDLEELEYPEKEANSICEMLPKRRINVNPLIGRNAKSGEILKSLKSGIDIFHFTGHGSMSKNKTIICCADRDLSIKQLLSVLDSASVPKISFINACESASEKTKSTGRWEAYNWANLLAAYGGQALIATLWPVIDQSSTTFAEWFYKQFIERKKALGVSLRYARRHTKKTSKSPFTWPAYILYGYPDLSFNSLMQ